MMRPLTEAEKSAVLSELAAAYQYPGQCFVPMTKVMAIVGYDETPNVAPICSVVLTLSALAAYLDICRVDFDEVVA